MDTILNLIPGRKQHSADEPNEEAIKRTHDYLRWVIPPSIFIKSYHEALLCSLHIEQMSPQLWAWTCR